MTRRLLIIVAVHLARQQTFSFLLNVWNMWSDNSSAAMVMLTRWYKFYSDGAKPYMYMAKQKNAWNATLWFCRGNALVAHQYRRHSLYSIKMQLHAYVYVYVGCRYILDSYMSVVGYAVMIMHIICHGSKTSGRLAGFWLEMCSNCISRIK